MIDGKLRPVEIKLTATPSAAQVDPINRFIAFAGEDTCTQGVIVCRIENEQALPNGHIAMPWELFPQWLQARLANGGID